jgi:uncharacterized protein with PIN domain
MLIAGKAADGGGDSRATLPPAALGARLVSQVLEALEDLEERHAHRVPSALVEDCQGQVRQLAEENAAEEVAQEHAEESARRQVCEQLRPRL